MKTDRDKLFMIRKFHDILHDAFNEAFKFLLDNAPEEPRLKEIKELFESIQTEREQKIFYLGTWLEDYLSWNESEELMNLLGYGKEPKDKNE